MPDQPSHRRRFQFRLRTLMIGVTLLAVPCGYFGWQAKIVRERKAMRIETEQHGTETIDFDGIVWNPESKPKPSLVRRWMGDKALFEADVQLRDLDSPYTARIKEVFPEATISKPILKGPPP